MNEKIRELAEQVGWREGNILMYEEDMEKFAELIVKECANFIDSHVQVDKYGEAYEIVYGNDLLKHFEVE